MAIHTFFVVKAHGEKEVFSVEKVVRALLRAGADEKLARQVADEVALRGYDGISTREVFTLTQTMLRTHSMSLACRYGLKDAIRKLGPAGFDFEKYLAQLFTAYGYIAVLPPLLQGTCVSHEVDVLLEKDERRIMVEAKLHHDFGFFVGIHDVMVAWARFSDLVDASTHMDTPHFDEVWLVTNSKFSRDALLYGGCKKITLLGWNHPLDRPLARWIEEKQLYPVTILFELSPKEQKILLAHNIVLLHQFVQIDLSSFSSEISSKRLRSLICIGEELLG